ncbi:MAG: hypothetical protein IPK13_03580 [Deltaproteobacteria bacterium]|nr:hypothetical protein [Deltaproteobacteria bacterium]
MRISSLRTFPIALVAILTLSACGDDDDESVPARDAGVGVDASTGDVGSVDGADATVVADAAVTTDAAVSDGSTSDAGTDVLAPPTIVRPSAASEVASPVRVAGHAEASAEVVVRVFHELDELGMSTTTAMPNGDFDAVVSFVGATEGASLRIEAVQSIDTRTSTAAHVVVTYRPHHLSGSVVQEDGLNAGDEVRVRLYDDDSFIRPIKEVVLTATVGEVFSAAPFSFQVAAGTYYLRAFRDAGGPYYETDPDGLPSIPVDPQSPATSAIVVTSGDSSGHALVLGAPSISSAYRDFNVYTENESAQPYPPGVQGNDNNWIPGEGLCGGYFLHMTARTDSGPAEDDALVLLPNGSYVVLRDDGGCGEAADNRGLSYDHGIGDGSFSAGIPNPTDALAGDYILHYRVPSVDLIHEERDTLEHVVKLDRNTPLTSPTGAAPAALAPLLTWSPVPGAAAYRVWVHGPESAVVESDQTLVPSYQAPLLSDDTSYVFELEIYDQDPEGGDVDVDAYARGIRSAFFSDSDGADTITIQGSIENLSSASGPYYFSVRDNQHWSELSTLVVPADASNYALKTLRRDPGTKLELNVFMDVDGSGDRENNRTYEIGRRELDGTQDLTVDLRFTRPVTLIAPDDGSTGVAQAPTLSWADYSAYGPVSAPWSYAVWIGAYEGEWDFPDVVYALPSSVTSLNMASLPAGRGTFDVRRLATCLMSGGAITDGESCTGGQAQGSLSSLSAGTRWTWGVVVLECDFADYEGAVDANQNGQNDYLECLSVRLDGDNAYANSPEYGFSVVD